MSGAADVDQEAEQGIEIVVSDTGSELHHFEDAQGTWADYTGKEWTTFVVDQDGEEHAIYCGRVLYCRAADASEIPDMGDLKAKHDTPFRDRNTWGYVA